MTTVKIAVELPKQLVERARAADIDVESFLSAFLTEWLTAEIRKRDAADNPHEGRDDIQLG